MRHIDQEKDLCYYACIKSILFEWDIDKNQEELWKMGGGKWIWNPKKNIDERTRTNLLESYKQLQQGIPVSIEEGKGMSVSEILQAYQDNCVIIVLLKRQSGKDLPLGWKTHAVRIKEYTDGLALIMDPFYVNNKDEEVFDQTKRREDNLLLVSFDTLDLMRFEEKRGIYIEFFCVKKVQQS